MDLKNARSRLAAARTSIQKADGMMAVCMELDKYQPHSMMIQFVRREANQQVGRLDFIIATIDNLQTMVEASEETD